MTEGHKDGMTEGGNAQPPAQVEPDAPDLQDFSFQLKIAVSAEAFSPFIQLKNKEGGPDTLTISTSGKGFKAAWRDTEGKEIKGKVTGEVKLSFKTTFAPGLQKGCLRCIIAGEVVEITLAETAEDWPDLIEKLNTRNAAAGFIIPDTKPKSVFPIRAEYFHAPGRLFDTPRNAAKQGDLPAIGRWYLQTAFNRTVGMAAAALTNTDTRDAILDWQSAKVADIADLIFCRSEEGTPAHGQNREDILKAFEALRAIPVPIVKIDWKQIGTDRNPRWVKEYKLRVASLFQGYGAVFVDKITGKEVRAADPGNKKNLVKGKEDRRKNLQALIAQNPADGILKSFPPDRFTLTRFEWRWNTDIAEDFICPQVALDGKGRPRLKLKKGRHIEGSRFINLNRRYFAVQKHLRDAGMTYAPRLLDLIVSEKTHISSRGKGAVWIEIESGKVIKWLDLWTDYQDHPKHVLEEHITNAVMALIKEKVMLPESWLVPQEDKNPDRRKKPFYRWKVAELWSTVALVTPEEAKEVEDELVKEAEAAEVARSQPKADQAVLPGMEAPAAQPIPSGKVIRAAREAAGLNLRRFAEAMKGPSFKTWSLIETGQRERSGRIRPEVWQRVRDFIAQHGPKAGSKNCLYDGKKAETVT